MSPLAYDPRTLTVATCSLFDQRRATLGQEEAHISVASQKDLPWQGDWVFRRKRLWILDRALRDLRPDVLFLQEVMSKKENPFDADRLIIQGGGFLEDALWEEKIFQKVPETAEEESLAIVLARPLSFLTSSQGGLPSTPPSGGPPSPPPPSAPLSSSVELLSLPGGHGLKGLFFSEGAPVLVFNVHREAQTGLSSENFIQGVEEELQIALEELLKRGGCSRRLILGGDWGVDLHEPSLQLLSQRLGLVDVSTGLCEKESLCHTLTPENEMAALAYPDTPACRTQRMFVPRGTLIHASHRIFHNISSPQTPNEVSLYGLSNLTVGPQWGWLAALQLRRCEESPQP